MTENLNPPKPIQKLLVLFTVIGLVLAGWLTGHILRHSILEDQFRHPPIPEVDPHIKNGYDIEFEGIRRLAVLTGNPAVDVISGKGTLFLGQVFLSQCSGNTYYTSLPAKCHSADGSLIRVGGTEPDFYLFPSNK